MIQLSPESFPQIRRQAEIGADITDTTSIIEETPLITGRSGKCVQLLNYEMKRNQ